MLIVVVLIPVQVAGAVENDIQVGQMRQVPEFLHISELIDESEMLADDVQGHVGTGTQQTCVGYKAYGRAVQQYVVVPGF